MAAFCGVRSGRTASARLRRGLAAVHVAAALSVPATGARAACSQWELRHVSAAYSVSATRNEQTGITTDFSFFAVPGFNPAAGDLFSVDRNTSPSFTVHTQNHDHPAGTSYSQGITQVFLTSADHTADHTAAFSGDPGRAEQHQGSTNAIISGGPEEVVTRSGTLLPHVWAQGSSGHGDVLGAHENPLGILYQTHLISGPNYSLDAQSSGTFAVSYCFNPDPSFEGAITPVVVFDPSAAEPWFRGGAAVGDLEAALGTYVGVVGSPTVERADGSVETITDGTEIYLGDQVRTGEGESLGVFFVDGTSFPIGEDLHHRVDNWDFDPVPPTSPNIAVEWLRGTFIAVSGALAGDGGDVEDVEPLFVDGTVGIRGSADDIVRESLQENPGLCADMPFGCDGVAVTTASPVGVYTFVEIPEGPFTFKFGYTFIGDTGELTVSLGGLPLLTLSATPEQDRLIQSVEIEVDWEASFAELAFDFDGPSGNTVVLSDLKFPGVAPANAESWFRRGDGPVQFVWIATQEQLDALVTAALAAKVPALQPGFVLALVALLFGASLRSLRSGRLSERDR